VEVRLEAPVQLPLAVAAEVGGPLASRDFGDGGATVGTALAVPDSFVLTLPFHTILQRGALEGLLFQRTQGSGYRALVAPASRLDRTAILPLRLITCHSVEGEREKCSVSHFSCLGVCRSVNGDWPKRH
jgi:hypothetical protein